MVLMSRFASRTLRFRHAQRRSYNFASSKYVGCFGNVPTADVKALRQSTIDYMKAFDADAWHSDPVCTLIKGQVLSEGTEQVTTDAFGKENGRIVHANEAEVKAIIEHIRTYKPPKTDYRKEVRALEQELLTTYAGQLIGNQALDFRKQDGVTEIEESVQANVIEQRMNDALFADEQAGVVDICRDPAYVGCVSNFSNFLDLFRKTLRNVELGVPAVVLSRSNTTQHMYRWTQLLLGLMEKHGVDSGMVTYASCDLPAIKTIFAECPAGPMYITSSRELAADVKAGHPNTVSSTGGPNTLVSTVMTPKIAEAIRFSAMIENSGQCTALRHAVVPCAEEDIVKAFDDAAEVETPVDSLEAGEFAGVFKDGPFSLEQGYKAHPKFSKIAYKVSPSLPSDGMDEHWRNVYVDVTTPAAEEMGSDAMVGSLSKWLVRNQPISLAVNGDLAMARKLFEQTGQVVYTVGDLETPALTCQARPQEGEIFGEFPVRRDLNKYTKYPVVVPSPTAAYNSCYNLAHLAGVARSPAATGVAGQLVDACETDTVRGFCNTLVDYLADSCGPKDGYGPRTTLWGLQRPPVNGTMTVIKCGAATTLDDVAPYLIPFVATNAREQVVVTVDGNPKLEEQLRTAGVPVDTVDAATEAAAYNVLTPAKLQEYPLAGQFVSTLLPVGHIKSTKSNDSEFADYFRQSTKWLKMAA